MSVGAQVSHEQINDRLKEIALRLHTLCRDARDFHHFVTQIALGQGGLEADFGFTTDDAYKVAVSADDLLLFAQLIENEATLPAAKDFYAVLGYGWGLGGAA